jgi:uncharacterized protein (TIGR02145 family)
MKSRLLVIILLLFAVMFNFCKKSEDTTASFPETLIKGDSSLVIYDTVTILKADTLGLGLKGSWSILVDSAKTGVLDSISNPTSRFHGKLFNTYKLRWTVSNGSTQKSKDITIRFDFTSALFPADSVPCYDSLVSLVALAPCKCLTGRWDVMQDTSVKKCKIYSPTVYTTNFGGTVGESYKLRWTLTPKDGVTQPRYKDFKVSFVGITTRDGEKYKVVKIGNQVWTAENLRYTYTSQVASMGTIYRSYETWFGYSTRYYNGNSKYADTYGCLYTAGTQLVIPGTVTVRESDGYSYWHYMNYPANGWYVARFQDYDTLYTYLHNNGFAGKEATALKSKLWGGTDDFGFNALPAGYSWNNYLAGTTTYSIFSPMYDEQGTSTTFWTMTYNNAITDSAKYVVKLTSSPLMYGQLQSIKKKDLRYYSIRLIKLL